MRTTLRPGFIGPFTGVIGVGSSVLRPGKPEATLDMSVLPPSVATTSPAAGDLAVDPKTREIRVTFSKDMMTERMWTVVQTSKGHFPRVGEGIRFLEDQRTCVIPVSLQPGRVYVLWFNKGKFNRFRDTGNNPAVPYQLVFQTRPN